MPTPCPRCRSTIATIGAGKDPHAASLICACDRWLGWMPAARFNFLSEVLRHFGRPIEPIEMGPLPDGGGVEAVRYHATLTEPQGGAMLMPKASDFFPSNYMRAADLAGKDRIVTIDRVETALFENDGKKQPKPVIYFKEAGVKPLGLVREAHRRVPGHGGVQRPSAGGNSRQACARTCGTADANRRLSNERRHPVLTEQDPQGERPSGP